MPTKSTNQKLQFKSETEEADWYHSPEGKRQATRVFQKAVRKGKLVVDERIPIQQAMDLARSGKIVVLKKGVEVKPTDPAVLQKLLDDARASMTQAVSLRIPKIDLETAKRIAEKKGVGYQSVLKQAIHDGLRQELSHG